MKNSLSIVKYIMNNNPWYQIPKRLLMAMGYQIYKRTTKGVLSKKLFNNQQILLFPNNPICSQFVYTAIPDKNEIFILRQFADSKTIFIDIGANVGAYSLLLMDKVQKVYAFEAHPATANFCKMNFLLNGQSVLQVIHAAVSENCEPKYFTNRKEGDPTNSLTGSKEEGILVNSITLDQFALDQNFMQDNNYVMKIDVEGFEHFVFQGAKEFLSRFTVRAIIFETFSEKNDQIMQLLHDLGYKTKMLGNNNMLASREPYAI